MRDRTTCHEIKVIRRFIFIKARNSYNMSEIFNRLESHSMDKQTRVSKEPDNVVEAFLDVSARTMKCKMRRVQREVCD